MVTASLLAILATAPVPVHRSGRMHSEWGPPPPVAPFVRTVLPSSRAVLPMIFPVLGPVRMTSGFNVNRGSHRHTGMDIVAPKMAPIVAPISGTLGLKRETFWIWNDAGWGILGTHLNDDDLGRSDHRGTRDVMFAPDLVPGQHVEAGRLIGYVGMSGDATGPHLHFELYAPGGMHRGGKTRGLLRDPAPSLHMAQRIKAPRPVLPDAHARPEKGQIRLQGCVRKVVPPSDGKLGSLTLLLTAKQSSTGRATAISRVRYLRVRASDAVVRLVGGWDALADVDRNQTLGVVLDASVPPDGATVERIVPAS